MPTEKRLITGVQHNYWENLETKQSGISSWLFSKVKGNPDKGFCGEVQVEFKAKESLTKELLALNPSPFPCICEVEFDVYGDRNGKEINLYTKCTPVTK